MTTLSFKQLPNKVPFAGEEGNLSVWHAKEAIAANSGDVIRMGVIPAGVIVTDMDLVFDDTGTSVTGKLGYQPVNSSDGPSAVDDYWLAAGQNLASAAGRLVSTSHEIQFEYPVYVILTVAGANFTSTPTIGFVAKGEVIGTK